MSNLAEVLAAITALGERIDGLGGQASAPTITATAMTGTLSMVGLVPTVTVGTVLDPKDMVRVSMLITVNESVAKSTLGLSGEILGCTNSAANVQRVYQLDQVAGVKANGTTIGLAPLPVSAGLNATAVNGATYGVPQYATVMPTLSFVSGTLQLCTRYHYAE